MALLDQRMAERGAELFRWIDGGAHVYVCGDAQQMAPDVHETLTAIVAAKPGLTATTSLLTSRVGVVTRNPSRRRRKTRGGAAPSA